MKTSGGLLLLMLGLALQACDAGEPAALGDDPATLHQHRDPRFELKVTAREVASIRTLTAAIVPRGDYHLSAEYPARMEYQTAGFERETLEPTGEVRSEKQLHFEASFPVVVGNVAQSLSGRLRFGVCLSDELCEPVDHPFAVTLP